MSRSGYSDDIDNWDLIRWRGQVASAIKGKRGQLFLLEMLAALDALPEKKLIARELETLDGAVCALGAVGKRRGIDLSKLDPEDRESVAGAFGIPFALTCEIVYLNDEEDRYTPETPEERWAHMRQWVCNNLRDFEPITTNHVPAQDRADAGEG